MKKVDLKTNISMLKIIVLKIEINHDVIISNSL